jgi:hypothetical protein
MRYTWPVTLVTDRQSDSQRLSASTSSHTRLKPNFVIWYEMHHPHGSRLPPLLSVNLSHAPPCSQSVSFIPLLCTCP